MLEKKRSVYLSLQEKIKNAKNIALISHKNPDIDTLWSSTAFFILLHNNFLYKNIDLICVDEIPKKYRFLKQTELFKKDFNPKNYDLIIFFDSWSKSQTWFDEKYPFLFDEKNFNTISIDHHITNEIYAKQNILNTTYSSTTMIVFEIASILNWKISPIVATHLLAWIYTDTWWLKHWNVNEITYLFSSKLKLLWWSEQIIIDKFFRNNKLSTIRLWWKILSDSFIDENEVLFSYVNKSMLESYNSDYEDISWVIDYLNMTQWIKYSTLLTQKWEYVKASLRTLRDDIDLTQIAKEFQGWWHKKASWFTTKAQVQEIKSISFKNYNE